MRPPDLPKAGPAVRFSRGRGSRISRKSVFWARFIVRICRFSGAMELWFPSRSLAGPTALACGVNLELLPLDFYPSRHQIRNLASMHQLDVNVRISKPRSPSSASTGAVRFCLILPALLCRSHFRKSSAPGDSTLAQPNLLNPFRHQLVQRYRHRLVLVLPHLLHRTHRPQDRG